MYNSVGFYYSGTFADWQTWLAGQWAIVVGSAEYNALNAD
jgi:hypothetical protein